MSVEIGKRICELMQAQRLTVREVAKEIGLSPSTLANWRAGSPPKDFHAVKRLAEVLGVSFEFILLGTSALSTKGSPLDPRSDEIFSGVVEVTIRRVTTKTDVKG